MELLQNVFVRTRVPVSAQKRKKLPTPEATQTKPITKSKYPLWTWRFFPKNQLLYWCKGQISGETHWIFPYCVSRAEYGTQYTYLALSFPLLPLLLLTPPSWCCWALSYRMMNSLLPRSCIFYNDVQAPYSTCVFACLLRFGWESLLQAALCA